MIGVLGFALAAGLVVGAAVLAVEYSSKWLPALGERQRRLAALKSGRSTAGTRTAARERESSHEHEADLAQRERIVERSLTMAERSIAEATARIEAREAALNIREAELRHQERALKDRQRSVSERERELTSTEAVPRRDEVRGTVSSDWWEKQLGPPAVGER